MFFKTKKKENEPSYAVIPKVQTAEGRKRSALEKAKAPGPKKKS